MLKKTKTQKIKPVLWLLTAAILLVCAVPARAAILFQDDSFADLESEGLILDALDQATGNITIQFGTTLGEFIQWNATDLRFEFSDAIDLNSNQIFEARVENVGSLPAGLAAGDAGRAVFLTTIDTTSAGCLGPACQPGLYIWDGSTWKPAGNQVRYVEPGESIQNAIDNLPAGGGKVTLLAGSHAVTAAIDITTDNVEITGEGPATVITTTSGSWTDGTSVDDAVIQVGPADGTAPVDNVLIHNFKIEVDPDVHAIQVSGGLDNTVRNMILESTSTKATRRMGILVTDGSAAAAARPVLKDNVITNSGGAPWGDGIHMDGNADVGSTLFGYGNGITDPVVVGNILNDIDAIALIINETTGATVNDNKLIGLGAASGGPLGIAFNDTTDATVVNNTIEGLDIAGGTGLFLFDNIDTSLFAGNIIRGGPATFTTGILNTAATNEENIIVNNQIDDTTATTTISDAAAETKLQTNHHRAATDPTTSDDITLGYTTGTLWINTTNNTTYLLVDDTATAAIWVELDYSEAAATPPITCSAGFAGKTFMDTDTGIVYVCDTSNGRNKWLSQDEKIIFGDDNGTCNSGNDPDNDEGCNVDWGNGLGPDSGTDLGFYIRHPITITGYGFSQDNDACTTGSFDLEVWSTGSNVDDNTYTLAAEVATGLTTETSNAGGLNVDIDGDQYVLWGIDNNCGQDIDDWNMVVYFRHRHD